MQFGFRKYLSCAALFLLFPGWASAFDFALSESEFLTWPPYCQSSYSTTPPGQYQAFSRDFPKAIVEQERARIGLMTFGRMHHWCAGMILLNRARAESDQRLREFELSEAAREADFTLVGLSADSPILSLVLVTVGVVCQEQHNDECASTNFNAAINARPADPAPYSALALLHRKHKDLILARDILLRGDKATEGQSPEIKYNLGIILLEMDDINGALEQAHLAYAGGYPLPGLKNKLKRLGRWADATEQQTTSQQLEKSP